MIPTNLIVHETSKVLELQYENGKSYRLPFEFLRVYSPSAEFAVMGLDKKFCRLENVMFQSQILNPLGTTQLSPFFRMAMIPVCILGTIYMICVKTKKAFGRIICNVVMKPGLIEMPQWVASHTVVDINYG